LSTPVHISLPLTIPVSPFPSVSSPLSSFLSIFVLHSVSPHLCLSFCLPFSYFHACASPCVWPPFLPLCLSVHFQNHAV
jgi:hypothetical protein